MKVIEPILQAVDFAEDNLLEEISVGEMARASGYSLYHFCRVFGRVTLHRPYDYLIRRRLSLAAEEIVGGEEKIINLAFRYRFATHEGFTRAFTRSFLRSPSSMRREGRVPPWHVFPRPNSTQLHFVAEQEGLGYEIRQECPLKISGLLMPTESRLKEIPRNLMSLQDKLGLDNEFSVVYFREGLPDFVLAGSDKKNSQEVHPAVVDKYVPAGRWLCYPFRGSLKSLPLALFWSLHSWTFNHDRSFIPEIAVAQENDEGFELRLLLETEV